MEEGLTADERERVVKGVVRLALFSVGGGRPFTRDDITKKVFGRLLPEAKAAQTRTLYNGVLEEARKRLQSAFGYDIVNLRDIARGGSSGGAPRGRGAHAGGTAATGGMSQESQSLTGSSQSSGARRPAAPGGALGGGTTISATGTSTYVLVNIMPDDLAVLEGPVCLPFNNGNNNESDSSSAAGTERAAGGGAEEQENEEDTAGMALRGLLMVVLGLVVMSGGRVSEDALLAHLHVLHVERAFGLAQRRDVEGQLARFVQQQYLARQYTKRAQPAGAAAAGEGAGSTAEYGVGARRRAASSPSTRAWTCCALWRRCSARRSHRAWPRTSWSRSRTWPASAPPLPQKPAPRQQHRKVKGTTTMTISCHRDSLNIGRGMPLETQKG